MELASLALLPEECANSQMVAILQQPNNMVTGYAEIPEPGQGEIRVKIKWVGICGSDLEAYRGTRKPEFLSIPARLGHEVAGCIDKLGPGVIGLRLGDHVTCRYVWGAFAEYIVCKPFNIKVVPPTIPLADVSLLEILPGVIHTAELAEITAAKNVLIMGQGVSGLVLTQVLRLFSPKNLVVTDLKDKNLALARKFGATHTYKIPSPTTPTMEIVGKDFPHGFDIVVPCLLEGDGMVDAIDCAAMCGKIIMYGCIGICRRPLDFFTVHRKRLAIISTEPRRDIDMRRYFQEGIQMAIDGLLNIQDIVTHTVPLSRVTEAFSIRDAQLTDAIHVLVDCERATDKVGKK
jgi:threonine dehydrogenase-like Zn-dependent dehydrogenase